MAAVGPDYGEYDRGRTDGHFTPAAEEFYRFTPVSKITVARQAVLCYGR